MLRLFLFFPLDFSLDAFECHFVFFQTLSTFNILLQTSQVTLVFSLQM